MTPRAVRRAADFEQTVTFLCKLGRWPKIVLGEEPTGERETQAPRMRILALPRYGNLGAGSRIRMLQYLPHLQSFGLEAKIHSLLADSYLHDLYGGRRVRFAPLLRSYLERLRLLALSKRSFDLIWLQWELFPWFPAWGEQLLARLGVPVVVDFDDAIFHRYDQHRNLLVRRCLGDKIDRVMRSAAGVVVGNEYLGERARKAGARRVTNIPSVIDLERYHVSSATSRPFTVGWVGSPSTSVFLKPVMPTLAKLGCRVILVGSPPIEDCGAQVEYRDWSEDREVADIQEFDVGIMPLPDEPWARGKCGYKLIQYMACGKPVIASPVGINCQIVEQGINGFLASTPAEWHQALTALAADQALATRLGDSARSKVESDYCVQVTAPRLNAAFLDAVESFH